MGLAIMGCKSDPEASAQATDSGSGVEVSKEQGQAFIKDEASEPNILNIAAGSPDHTTLTAAVQAADLENALVNAGPLMDNIARLAFADNRMAIGSSANVSLQGVKFRATEIEQQILDAADITIDYGLMRWNRYNHSSTMINVSDMEVIRYGSCFDLIDDILQTHFDIVLPPNPYEAT